MTKTGTGFRHAEASPNSDRTTGRRRVAAVLGDGQMAARCAQLIAERDDLAIPLIVHHVSDDKRFSPIDKISKKFGVSHLTVSNVNDPEALAALSDIRPDIIFSINNWDEIRADLLATPTDGIVNFHNGPLPDYRGVNVPSWAIINGEVSHGVTWHFMNREIDAGSILASTTFPLRSDETAITLILQCIETGVKLFPALLDRYVSGTLEPRPQTGGGRYFSRKDSPNQGYLNFDQGYEQLSALVRGLTFRPIPNQFTDARILSGDFTIVVSEISRVRDRYESDDRRCGEIVSVEEHGIVVRAADSQVRISGLLDENLMEIHGVGAIELHGMTVGSILHPPAKTPGQT